MADEWDAATYQRVSEPQLAWGRLLVERIPLDGDEHAIDAGAGDVVVLGALGGGRLDHEVANLLLLADRRWVDRRIRIVRGGAVVRVLQGEGVLDLEGAEGDLVTLLPVGGDAIGVRTHGLRFPLDGETLQLGRSRGLSNQVEHVPASVSLERGTLLVIETRKELSR